MNVISQSNPRARKHHRCSLCSGTISNGEHYLRQFVSDGGDVWTWRECQECTQMLDDLRAWGCLGVQEDVWADHYWNYKDEHNEMLARHKGE